MVSVLHFALLQHFSDKDRALLHDLFADTTMHKQVRWSRIINEILTPTIPYSIHYELYKLNYKGCEEYESMAWFPHNYTIKNTNHVVTKTDPLHTRKTNIEQIMEVKGLHTYQDFYQWSVAADTCEEYWDHCIKRLAIQFHTPYTKVFDTTSNALPDDEYHGLKSVDYLAGATLNIADSCFPKEYMQASAEESANIPPAIVYANDTNPTELLYYSHKQLAQFSAQVALGLVTRYGVQVGDTVGICMPMSPEAIACYIGIIQAGCAVVSIADSFSAAEIATRMKLANAKIIITQDVIARGDKFLPLYTRVLDAKPEAVVVIPLATHTKQLDMSIVLRANDCNLYDILPLITSEAVTQYTSTPVAAHHICNVLFSSGTTGEPKAIPWYHSNPIKAAVDGHIHQDIQPGDVVCWPTNLGWMMGPWILFQLMNRATIAIYNGVSTTFGFMQFVQAARVNMLGVVPSIVKAWKSIVEKQQVLRAEQHTKQGTTAPLEYYWPFDWSYITRFSSTGEASDVDSMLWLMSRVAPKQCSRNAHLTSGGYAPVMEYCGGTEIAGSFLSSTLLQPNIPALFSTPVCGSRVCILDDEGGVMYSDLDIHARVHQPWNGDVCTDHTVITGEIALIPPSLGLSTRLLNRSHHECYYDEMPLTRDKRLLRRHGDEVQNLPGSYYRALGRCDDTMNLGGIKVSSIEIERVCNISDTSIISETAAIAIHPKGGGPSQLVLVVLTTPGCSGIIIESNTTGASLMEMEAIFQLKVKATCQHAIKTHLNPLFHIYDVVLVTELPRTASNKIMRRVLRDNYVMHRDR